VDCDDNLLQNALRPSNADLAKSLNSLSIRLSESSHHEQALEVIQEAVDLRRQLAAERPSTFNSDLKQIVTQQPLHPSICTRPARRSVGSDSGGSGFCDGNLRQTVLPSSIND